MRVGFEAYPFCNMGDYVQIAIVATSVAIAVVGIVRYIMRRQSKNDGCKDCPLKDGCGKRGISPRNNDEAPCDRN